MYNNLNVYAQNLISKKHTQHIHLSQHESKQMKATTVSREITALNEKTDAILIFDRQKRDFKYPIHFHPEYELNYLYNAEGAERIMGDSVERVGPQELCLVGPNLYHAWKAGSSDHDTYKREVTVQFVASLFPQDLLEKDIYKRVAEMLKKSEYGLLFSAETAEQAEPMLTTVSKTRGFEAYIEFLKLLRFLAESPDQRVLSKNSFQNDTTASTDNRIERIHDYIVQHYKEKITLGDAAEILNMSNVSVTRLIKQRTGKSFIDFLNEIRIGFAARQMVDSDMSISEICFSNGFNNISNFNRTFRKKQGLTPTEFRQKYLGKKKVL